MGLICAFDKEFSLCANYPKGHGALFREWMKSNHPEELMLHVTRSGGNRMDILLEASPAIYWNRQYCIEFLDDKLRMIGSSNILQMNLFILLSCLEVVALTRLLSILYIAICIPLRWISGKTHTLKEYNWGARSMGRVLDVLEASLEKIKADPKLIYSEIYMMNIFQEFIEELPPLKEYLKHEFEIKKMAIAKTSGTKVVYLNLLRKELFDPTREDNVDCTEMMETLGSIAVTSILGELRDPKKATYKYLSLSKSIYSWDYCPETHKTDMLGKHATNDIAESSFASLTSQLQKYSRINLAHAAAISDMQKNGFLSRKGKIGLFHQFPKELRAAVVVVAVEDAPATRKSNNLSLQRQLDCKREKEEMLKQKNMSKATEEFIDATYFHRMGNSEACWTTVSEVTKTLDKLNTQTEKREALKDNINIRVKGYGWTQFHTAWSKDGRAYSIKYLEDHLKKIIRQEKRMQVPQKPQILTPKRKSLPILGTLTSEVKKLDGKYIKDKGYFEKNAKKVRNERERMGIGSMRSEIQSFVAPIVDHTFVGEKIEVLHSFHIIEDGKEDETLNWCPGKVTRVYEGVKHPTVGVMWDKMEGVYDAHTTKSQVLLPSTWNNERKGGCRMDVYIDDSDSELEGGVNDEEN